MLGFCRCKVWVDFEGENFNIDLVVSIIFIGLVVFWLVEKLYKIVVEIVV